MADSGQDAVVERFYFRARRRTRLVFQITTQETVESKLKETIQRLEDAKVEYTGLHLVTSQKMTVARQEKLNQIANEFDVPLEITERATLSLVLSDYSNGIFKTHFPDLERQIGVARAAKGTSSLDRERLLNMAMAFTGISESDRARRSVLRELVLVLLVASTSSGAKPSDLVGVHKDLLPAVGALQQEQVETALDYWVKQGFVSKSVAGLYTPKSTAIDRADVAQKEWDLRRTMLASDVADSVENALGRELDSTIRGMVERNAYETITDIFRLFGLEVASQILGDSSRRVAQIGSHEAINSTIKKDLPDDIGEVSAASLGDLLSAPNEEQASALNDLALGYLGASLVQVDPAVREFQATRFREKSFVLDTDFLLDCLVSHQPRQGASLSLVRKLLEMGARVIVPEVCISEAAAHASIAHRTVDYFG